MSDPAGQGWGCQCPAPAAGAPPGPAMKTGAGAAAPLPSSPATEPAWEAGLKEGVAGCGPNARIGARSQSAEGAKSIEFAGCWRLAVAWTARPAGDREGHSPL